MPNILLDIDQLNQILSAVKSNLEISLPIPIDKGGTGVTSVEDIRKEVTGFDKVFLSDKDNISIFIGNHAAESVSTVKYNNIIGHNAAMKATIINRSDIIGVSAASSAAEIYSSTIIGNDAGSVVGEFNNAILIGSNVTLTAANVSSSVLIGSSVGYNYTKPISSTILIGSNCGVDNTYDNTMDDVVAIGESAFRGANVGNYGVFIGARCGYSNPSKSNRMSYSTFVGSESGRAQNASAYMEYCVGVGHRSINITAEARQSVAIGCSSASCPSVIECALVGNYSGRDVTLERCSALGYNTFYWYPSQPPVETITNSTAIGYQANVTGDNQIQLGNSSTTTYVYGSVQDRSDVRDKANITDLDYDYKLFISKLKPRNFQWDYREDYLPEHPPVEDDTTGPQTAAENTVAMDQIVHDGTHVRSRRHNGFIAQEVKQIMDEMNFDFAGYQDHSINGGADVLSLGYTEFIPPMVACIQDLMKENEQLRAENAEIKNDIALIKKALNM